MQLQYPQSRKKLLQFLKTGTGFARFSGFMQEAEITVYTFDGESYALEVHRVGTHGWRAGGMARGQYIESRGLTCDEALLRWVEKYADAVRPAM